MIQVRFPLSQRQVAQARHITGGEESLGRGSGFGPLLLPLSSSDRKVRGLCSIVLPKAAGSMQVPQIQLIQSRSV
jgi:hypothetical protein